MPYTVTPTALPDVLILEPKVFGDARGFFFESFNQRDFAEVTGLDVQFVQDNHSQAIRLPAELRLPDSVKRVDVRRAFQGSKAGWR